MNRHAHRGPPYEVVLFDCDSTLSAIEGLDRLAQRAGLAERLAPITAAAMDGRQPFERAYAERLALLRPDAAAVDWLAQQYLAHVVAGANALIRRLHERDKIVHIVSGGIRQALLPLGAALGIAATRVHGVSLAFDCEGRYAGYDADSLLARQHGKAILCREILAAGQAAVLVGDGVTDLEARATGVDFIGFGGVARRPAIERGAAVYYTGTDLTGLLPLLLTAAELEGLPGQGG